MKAYVLEAPLEWVDLRRKFRNEADNVHVYDRDLERKVSEMICPEEDAPAEHQQQCRQTPPDFNAYLYYQCKYRRQPKKGSNWDVIGGGGLGFGNFVSERVMHLLKPHIGHECDFLPVEMRGIDGQYYGMWVRNIVDAMDEEKSVLNAYTRESAPHLKDFWMPVFKTELIKDRYLFRLPGNKYWGASLYDFATERFLQLVTDLGIYGFEFCDGVPLYRDTIYIVPNEPKKKIKSAKPIVSE
jgi:hypothetical protein